MGFEIISERKPTRTRRGYEFFIRSRDLREWSMRDLVPYMKTVSDASKNYKLVYDEDSIRRGKASIVWSLITERKILASMTLEKTVVEDVKCLVVVNYGGIGGQMIEKYAHSVEGRLN